jgi:hypothetical protein
LVDQLYKQHVEEGHFHHQVLLNIDKAINDQIKLNQKIESIHITMLEKTKENKMK